MLPTPESVPPIRGMRRNRALDLDEQWWDRQVPIECANAIFAKARELRNLQRMSMLDLAISVITYHGPACARVLGAMGLPELLGPTGWTRRTAQIHNLTAWGVDTVAALVSLNKPKAMFVTNGADYDKQRRAKKLTDFVEAVGLQNKVYSLAADIILDGLVFGDGIVKVYMGADGRVKYGRVLRPNLIIDEDEAIERNPRQMFERHIATRDQVMGLWPEKRQAIAQAPSATLEGVFGSTRKLSLTRNIEVVEAWRLPEGKAVRGRHVICVENAVLVDEPWNDDEFPFVFFKWKKARLGFWGISLAQELRPLQVSVNMLNDYIMETIRRVSRARVWLPEASKVSVTQLGNGMASAYKYSGLRPPVIDNSDAVPKEMLLERDEKLQTWAPTAGVGPDAAAGSMPANLRSGEAQKVHLQFMDQRLNMVMDEYADDFHMGLARKSVKTIRKYLEEEDKTSYVVKVPRGDRYEELDFKDAELPESDVELQLSPTNFFADTPEARVDQIVDLGQNALIDKVRMLAGIDFPDVKSLTRVFTEPLTYAQWAVEELRNGNDVEVDDLTPVNFCVQEATTAVFAMRRSGASEEKIDPLVRFIRMCVAEQKRRLIASMPTPAQGAAPGAPGGAPIAAPPLPPQGQLQPFKPAA
jgi:hypothetical protein